MKEASASAIFTISNINALVTTNGPAIYQSVSRLTNFTEHLDEVALGLKSLVETNRNGIDRAVSNIEDTTVILKGIMKDVQDGKGLAGKLLRDEAIAAKTTNIVHDLTITTSNLSITTSNLNRLGLWSVLWKKKEKAHDTPLEQHAPLQSPKDRAD